MKILHFFPLLFVLISIQTNAQEFGGGNLNPGIVTNKESIEKFQDLRIGLSVHWGPSSLGGKEISWSRGREINKEVYDNFYKEFNPVNFDADEWAQLMVDAGMKYISITAKHHDGFCLWHSDFTDYDMENTPFKRDILKELSEACAKKDILFGTYYSLLDWYQPDYYPYDHGGPGTATKRYPDTPNLERYLVYMKNQLHELANNYGSKFMQFDGEWDSTWTHQLGSDLYLYLRKLDDKILVSSRTDKGRYNLDPATKTWVREIYAGDFEERERFVEWIKEETEEFGKSAAPWQAWVTIDKAQWSWNETPKLLTPDEIILDMLLTIGDNGNYLINVGPRPDGSFSPEMAANIRVLGAWIKKYEDAIYGTRGGPFVLEDNFTSTIKNQTIYLFVLNKNIEKIELNSSDYKIKRISDYQGNPIKFSTKNKIIEFDVQKNSTENIRVLKINI
jgi:alpha-L-fucosidase